MKNDQTSMDELSLTEVLKAVLEHEQQTQKFMNGMEAQRKQDAGQIEQQLKHNEQLISNFEKKYSNIRIDAPKPDLSEVNATLDKGFEKVKEALAARPHIQRRFQVNLFPEYHSKEYFKLVYGRLLFWLYLGMLSFFGYRVATDALDTYRAHQYNKEANICVDAWNDVYNNGSKELKKKMSKAMMRAKANK